MRTFLLICSISVILACTPRVQGLEGVAEKTFPTRFATKAEKPGAPIAISRAEQIGDLLALDVTYSGGCEAHTFELVTLGNHQPTYPPELLVKIIHNANADRCRNFIQDRIYFDLQPFRLDGTNRINLIMEDQQITQTYDY